LGDDWGLAPRLQAGHQAFFWPSLRPLERRDSSMTVSRDREDCSAAAKQAMEK